MKFKITITAIIFLPIILQHGTAQNNNLKFNLVEGPNGKLLGNITAITQGSAWIHVVLGAERTMPLPLRRHQDDQFQA